MVKLVFLQPHPKRPPLFGSDQDLIFITDDFDEPLEDELLPEYNFDYSKARPNRFAIAKEEDSVTVKLELDVAKVFKTSEAVNKALRAILSAIAQQ